MQKNEEDVHVQSGQVRLTIIHVRRDRVANGNNRERREVFFAVLVKRQTGDFVEVFCDAEFAITSVIDGDWKHIINKGMEKIK